MLKHILFIHFAADYDNLSVIAAINQTIIRHIGKDGTHQQANLIVSFASTFIAVDLMQINDIKDRNGANIIFNIEGVCIDVAFKRADILQPGQVVDLPVHGVDLYIDKAIGILSVEFILCNLRDNDIVAALAVIRNYPVAEALSISYFTAFGEDAVFQIGVSVIVVS